MKRTSHRDYGPAKSDHSDKGRYTFSLFDIGGTISSDQLKKLLSPIANLWKQRRKSG